jgi:hypothetical protein
MLTATTLTSRPLTTTQARDLIAAELDSTGYALLKYDGRRAEAWVAGPDGSVYVSELFRGISAGDVRRCVRADLDEGFANCPMMGRLPA